MGPDLVAEAPAAWAAAEIERPPLSPSSGAAWTTWRAARAADDGAAMVAACVAAPVPGWVEDMRPPFVARTVALAGATAGRIAGAPVEARGDGERLALHLVGRDGGPVGAARTFLGFDDANAVTCFVVCAARHAEPNAAPAACNEVVMRARLDGGAAPPRPGIALGAVTWAVHHPRPTALGLGAAAVLAGVIAVAARRKPRTRT